MEKIDLTRIPNFKNCVKNGADAIAEFVRKLRDSGGTKDDRQEIERVINILNGQAKRLNDINSAIDQMVKDINANIDDSNRRTSAVDPGCIDFEQYISAAGIDYSSFKTSQMFGSGKLYNTNVFSTRYNDLPAFLRSEDYEFYNNLNGLSQITDLSLWREAFFGEDNTFNNSYSQKRLQAALLSLVENIPEEYEPVPSLFDKIEEAFPGESKKIVERLVKFYKSFNGTATEFMDRFIETMAKDAEDHKLTAEQLERFSEFCNNNSEQIYLGLETCGDVLDTLSDIGEVYDYTKKVFTVLDHINTDYSRQLGYLHSFREALAASGLYYSGSPLVTALNDIENQFKDDMYYVTKEAYKEIRKQGDKFSVKLVLELIPELKLADSILKLFSAGVKLAAGDEISAVQKLEGMQMYDSVLTKSYENYIDMMQQGVADNDDMKNADNTLELLIANKISIYKAMNEIKYSSVYDQKIEELRKMQKLVA